MSDMLPFADYRPDVASYKGAASQTIRNVVPRGDGYGPFSDLVAFTTALPAACRGYFYARKTDGSVAVLAGTSTRLYLLSNTDFTWSDVSAGGGAYTALPSSNHWQLAQFGNFVIAVQPNVVQQVYDLTSLSKCAAHGGTAAHAEYIAMTKFPKCANFQWVEL